jgi:hypothetical protein
MGQYHYLINLDKKQFVHPHQIGNGLKLHEQVGWEYSTATALVMLLAASSRDGGRGGGDFHAAHQLIGSWAGDRVAFVGDYAEPEDIHDCNARSLYEECEKAATAGPATGKKTKGWINISVQVREMMSAEFRIRYTGTGWLEIVEDKGAKTAPPLAPDLIITSRA